MKLLLETNLPNLYYRGKVRDTYDLGDRLLIVATDRISAFDFVLPNGIPDKGMVLNQLSAFWFERTAELVPNHFIAAVDDLSILHPYFDPQILPSYLIGRSMIVKKAERIDVECVVRGYISGSAWAEYKESGTVSSIPMPKGLKESEKLAEPMFTPTTKAESGHDQPLSMEEMKRILGERLAEELREKSMAIYRYAHDYALPRGIIIADTKMEFGIVDGELVLIDELLTPDSSRFWDMGQYEVGHSQPSFDKQPVRDWLTSSGWNKEPPPPPLSPDIIEQTTKRYHEAYRRLTGREL